MDWLAELSGFTWVWVFVSFLAILANVLLTMQGFENHRYVCASCDRPRKPTPQPYAALIVPVKGIDPELRESLNALLHQDYARYEVHFVGEDEGDEAFAVIDQLIDESNSSDRVTAHWHAAGAAIECGQKIHNLTCALSKISEDVEIVAFADSDAKPDAKWLSNLTYRLIHNEKNGATTGYRVCVPQRWSAPNWLMYTINASVGAMLVRRGRFNMVWGGAWAVRRHMLPAISEAWDRTISDDLVASCELKRQRQKICLEPSILVPSATEMTWGGLMEFLRRQFFMTHRYTRTFWRISVLCWTCMLLGLFGNAVLTGIALSKAAWWWWIPAAVASVCYVAGLARAFMRQAAVNRCLPHLRERLRWVQRVEFAAYPLASIAGWIGLISAGIGRTVTWRGIRYELGASGEVTEIQHPSPQRKAGQHPHQRAA